MSKQDKCKIHINHKEKAIVDGFTGEVYRPSCWDDLAPYISWLENNKQQCKAQKILKRILKGEKVISNMIEEFQRIAK